MNFGPLKPELQFSSAQLLLICFSFEFYHRSVTIPLNVIGYL